MIFVGSGSVFSYGFGSNMKIFQYCSHKFYLFIPVLFKCVRLHITTKFKLFRGISGQKKELIFLNGAFCLEMFKFYQFIRVVVFQKLISDPAKSFGFDRIRIHNPASNTSLCQVEEAVEPLKSVTPVYKTPIVPKVSSCSISAHCFYILVLVKELGMNLGI